jgi:hypothetical protein
MHRKIKGLPLIAFFVVYLLAVCIAGESDFLKPGEIRMAENHCKFFLRTLGTSQLAYMESNPHGDYGTWWTLKQAGYVEEAYDRSNYIENYSLTVFHVAASSWRGIHSAHDSTFTIVAVPTKYRNQLRTFAIGNDQIPVAWIGDDSEFGMGYFPPTTPGLRDNRYWDTGKGKKKSRVEDKVEKKLNPMENRCKLSLRALGAAQVQYMDSNRAHDYGSWQSLLENRYIQQGNSRTNMIDNYSICVFETTASGKRRDGRSFPSRFTIVAIPRSQYNRLRTFAICDEQTPLVWVGSESEFAQRLHHHPPSFSLDNSAGIPGFRIDSHFPGMPDSPYR